MFHWTHLSYIHPVTSENQFHCTRLYRYSVVYIVQWQTFGFQNLCADEWNDTEFQQTTSIAVMLFCLKLRQDPLEAILVTFGRSFFLFESSWKNMKKWHHFCAHAQWWSTWRRENVEKGHLAPSNWTFLLIIAIDRNGFRRMKEGPIYKMLPQIFLIFAPELSYDLSKFRDDFTPFFFRLWKTITKSLGKN